MAETVLVLLVTAVAAAIGALGFTRNRAARRAFESGASLLGLPSSSVSGTFLFGLKGQLRGFPFLVKEESRGKSGVWTEVEVAAPDRIPADLRLAREGFGASLGKLFVGEDIATGDPRFDEAVVVRGEAASALALLDGETRVRVTELVRQGAKLSGGTLTLALHGRFADGDQIATLVRALVALAERLAQGVPAVEGLAAIARHDAVTGARHRSLQELVASFPDHPTTRAALRTALTDRGPEVRLVAAVALGAEGLPCLRGIVEHRGTPEAVAIEAVASLGEQLPETTALARLEAAVPAGHERLAHALIERLGASTLPEVTARLTEHLADWPPRLASACARALGRSGSAATEPALVAALSSPSADLRAAAAEALGTVGSVRSVVALTAAASSGLFTPSVRQAALEAIVRIQARLTGAAPGQLALADGSAGALSLPEQQDGGMSLVEDGREPCSDGRQLSADPASTRETRRATES